MLVSFYAGLLGLLFFAMSLETIKARRKHLVSLGSGPNNEIAAIVSAHANFAAYVPILLLLVWFVSQRTIYPTWLLHMLCGAFTLGRLLHYVAFRGEKMKFRYRVWGMYLTLWPLIILSILNVISFFWN